MQHISTTSIHQQGNVCYQTKGKAKKKTKLEMEMNMGWKPMSSPRKQQRKRTEV